MSCAPTRAVPAPAGREWTAEQQRAIDRRHGDLLLDAAAGSGKTSVLVERFVCAVLQDGVDVAAMLTITFTEKAAAELRDRIRRRLHELGAPDAARQTEAAHISTIHGFCARVLRSNALAAGLDPRFTVLDRSQSDPLAATAFDDALAELAAADPGVVDLVAAYTARSLRAAILAAYGQLRAAGDPHPRLPECPPDTAARAGAELARAAAAVAAELGEVAEPGRSVLGALDRVGRCLELVRAGADAVWPAELEAVRLPRNGTALSTDACLAYAAALDAYRAQVAARAARPVRDLLDRLLDGFGRRYAARKREVSGLDFEDLELITRRLLDEDDAVRERYAARFERIMVDEFQDTNRVQLALIEAIARDNLFTVGDAQQSIYGFRHADVELFERRGAQLEAAGARETLQTNFRSRPEILDALNLAFGDESVASHLHFTPLRAGRAPAVAGPGGGDAEPPVELVLVDKGADWEQEGVASPWRLAEARTLAARLAELVAGGWSPSQVVVLLRATTDMRAYERALEERGLPTYVIGGRGYWSHPQVVDLVAYLRALTNPRDEASLYGVLASPLVGASLDALVVLGAAAREAARDPWWVLRDPHGGLDAVADEDRERLRRFAGWFAAERERAARCGIEELIEAALDHSGYDVAMLALPGGRRRLANVRKLMRLGREHEDEHGPDLRGFLDLIADREAGRGVDARESEAPVEGEGLDAIRLMTIHRAKGLEFPVVAVADLGRSVRPPADILRVDADGGLGLRLARAGVPGREPALGYKEIGDRRRRAEEAEERRLFYVAMTRAQERLVLSGALKFDGYGENGVATGGGPAAWIAPAFVPELGAVLADGGGEVRRDGVRIALRIGRPEDCRAPEAPPDDGSAPPPPPGDGSLAVGATSAPPPPPPGAAGGGEAPPVATLSYSALQEHHRCGYRFYAERVLGLPPVPDPPGTGAGAARPAAARSAADRGILLHALLERLHFRRPVVPDAPVVRAAAARVGLWPPPGPAEADELAATVARFAASPLCARLGRAIDVRREERFAFPIGSGPARPLVVGVIDVLARETGPARPGGILVVDYKSDHLAGRAPDTVVAHDYDVQRIVYALAALRAGAAAVEVAYCFLESPEEPVITGYHRSDVEQLELRLTELSAGLLRGDFTVTPMPHRGVCAGCPAADGLCSWPAEMTRRESPDRLF